VALPQESHMFLTVKPSDYLNGINHPF